MRAGVSHDPVSTARRRSHLKEQSGSPVNLNVIADALIDRVVERVCSRIEAIQTLRPRLLTVKQAALYLSRTESAIRKLGASGAFPCTRADGRVQFDIRDLDQWIEQNKE